MKRRLERIDLRDQGPQSRGSLSPKMLDNSSLAAAVASGGLPDARREMNSFLYYFCYGVQAPLAGASPQSENGGL
jgi:hypothetical protein